MQRMNWARQLEIQAAARPELLGAAARTLKTICVQAAVGGREWNRFLAMRSSFSYSVVILSDRE
jgi:hypothetical protein